MLSSPSLETGSRAVGRRGTLSYVGMEGVRFDSWLVWKEKVGGVCGGEVSMRFCYACRFPSPTPTPQDLSSRGSVNAALGSFGGAVGVRKKGKGYLLNGMVLC